MVSIKKAPFCPSLSFTPSITSLIVSQVSVGLDSVLAFVSCQVGGLHRRLTTPSNSAVKRGFPAVNWRPEYHRHLETKNILALSNQTIRETALVLKRRYKDFDHNNPDDPFDQLLFVICSVRTTYRRYEPAYQRLKKKFPTRSSIKNASIDDLASPLKGSGLHMRKALMIHKIVERLCREFGVPTLDPLLEWPDAQSEEFLMTLPGVGKKVARCVMLCSLKREVFPVDSHCWRIARRLGWIRPTLRNKTCSPGDMDRLQEKIPKDLRFSLHVNMISFGRDICTAPAPTCRRCPLESRCPKVDVTHGK